MLKANHKLKFDYIYTIYRITASRRDRAPQISSPTF